MEYDKTHYDITKHCRICEGNLETVLDLGELYPSNFLDDDSKELNKFSLCLSKCDKCDLVQLKEAAPLDLMYRQYWYKSSLNSSMVTALKDVVDDVLSKVRLAKDDIIVDIGCNDGTMFDFYPKDVTKVGFDPALNLADEAKKHCDFFINDYFDGKKYPMKKRAMVVTSIAMFYDLEFPIKFINEVKSILDEYGVWVIQFTDLLSMFSINAFDNICHEHLEYYSLNVLDSLFDNYGLEIFDVSYNKVNGGSIRAFIGRKGVHNVRESVLDFITKENDYMRSFEDPFKSFADRVENIKQKMVSFIDGDKDVCVLGASTKGNTLLQYFDLDYTKISAAGEVNKDKFGLRTVCTDIPIVDEEEILYTTPADYCLILPWHFIDNFIEKKRQYLDNGGVFIVPMPLPALYYVKDEEVIKELL